MTDPGWRPSARLLLGLVFPPLLARTVRNQRSTIEATRTMHVTLLVTPLLFLMVLTFVRDPSTQPTGVRPGILLVAVAGIVAVILSRVVATRPLPTSDAALIRERFQARYFVSFAVAESAWLFGFVAFFVTDGSLVVYLVGLVIGFVAMMGIAPGRAMLARDQKRLQRAGSTLDLLEVLQQPAPRR